MPSSDPITIPKVLSVVMGLQPRSILDVGAGTGKYGLLFREYLDLNHGRLDRNDWQIKIDAVEIDESYLTEVHGFVYNDVIISDWLDYTPTFYDVIFMGDVLEHWPDSKWQKALMKAKQYSKITIIVAPNWRGSIEKGSWFGHDQEAHRVALTPQMVGGRCLFANSKAFMCIFDNTNRGLLEGKNVCL